MNKNDLLIILLLFLLMPSCNNGKSETIILPTSNIPTNIKELEEQAFEYLLNNQVGQAIELYQEVISLVPPQDSLYLAKLYNDLGSCYFQNGNYEKTISFIKKSLNYYPPITINQIIPNIKSWSSGNFLLISCYRNLKKNDTALMLLGDLDDRLIQQNTITNFNDFNWFRAKLFTWRALIYNDIGEFEKSISENIKAIKLLKEKQGPPCIISNNYSQLGQIFIMREEYNKAELYYIKAASIIDNCFSDSSIYYAEKITDLGYLYFETHKYKEALECFKIAHKIINEHSLQNSLIIAYSHNNLGDVYCSLKKYLKGINQYLIAIKLFKKHNSKNDISIVYHNLGNAYNDLNNFQLAGKYYNLSLTLSKVARKQKNLHTAYTHQRLGQINLKQNKFKTAINHYSNAIKELSIFENNSTSYNVKFLRQGILSRTELFIALYYKGYCELNTYLLSNNKKFLTESIISFNKALQISDVIRNHYNSEKSKLSLSKLSSPLVENYLLSLIHLSAKQPDIYLDNKILEAVERNKYTALRSLIYSTKPVSSSVLPNPILKRIDTLQKRIRYNENILSKNKTTREQSSYIQNIQTQLFTNTYTLDTLLSYLKITFPNYRNKQYDFSYYSIRDLQEVLPDSTGIIEYFLNDSIIVIIGINKNTYHIHYSFSMQEFIEKLKEFDNAIQFSNTDNFINNSKYIFDKLIKPILPIIENVTSLIIIPDEYFADLPFEVLINSEGLKTKDLQKQNYLIENYDISYHYSLNLWADNVKRNQINNKKNWVKDFSGFAPLGNNYSTTGSKFSNHKDLPFSSSEINNIFNLFAQNGFNASSYIGKYSKENAIVKELKNSKIVHIASHGVVNNNPINNHIVLQYTLPSQTENYRDFDRVMNDTMFISIMDGKLSLPEVYNLKIYSDLVTLSTCSSGLGSTIVGEGNKSLALAFYYSGANNILYTLWDVSDQHTNTFMTTFYTYVCHGFSYSKALRKTKIDFINSKYHLPIFWSGYLLNS